MSHYKPYPAYRDSGVEWIGPVPEHWSIGRLRDFVRTISTGPFGTALGSDDYVSNGVPVINPSHISESGCVPDATVTVDQGKALELAFWAMRPGDIVTARRGELGRAAIIGDQQAGWICGTGSIRITPDASKIASEYVHVMLQADYARRWLELHSVGSTMPNLSETLIGDLPLAVPPTVREQQSLLRRSAEETAGIDALIAKKTRFIALLKEKRQALITHAVTQGLDPNVKMKDSGVAWIGEVPEHWTSVPIRRVAQLESGHTPSRLVPAYWENCTIPWYTLADIWQVRKEGRVVVTETSEKVSELGVANSSARRLPAGTVILSRTASVGFPAIIGCEMAVSQDFAAWICGKRLDNQFLYLTLKAMRQEIVRLTMGSTHKTVYMPDIEQLRCALPPVDEQRRIVESVAKKTARIDSLERAVNRSITLLKERRAALITAAVTGQIDLRDEAPLPESRS